MLLQCGKCGFAAETVEKQWERSRRMTDKERVFAPAEKIQHENCRCQRSAGNIL